VEVETAAVADCVSLKGKKFIRTPKNPPYVESIFQSSQGITTDLEEDFLVAVSSLKSCVASIAQMQPPPIGEVTTIGSCATRKGQAKACNDLVSSAQANDATFSSGEYRWEKFLLASPVLSKDGAFKPPMLTPQVSAIFDLKH
jgi:hypothetical protein